MSINKRYKPEQIVTLLRQIEVEIANGKTTPQACKEAQITVRDLRQSCQPASAENRGSEGKDLERWFGLQASEVDGRGRRPSEQEAPLTGGPDQHADRCFPEE